MTGTELLANLVEERTRLLAEVERLRARVAELEEDAPRDMTGAEFVEHLKLLQKKLEEREAEIATMRGTLSRPAIEDDQPAIIHHDVPPNAPR